MKAARIIKPKEALQVQDLETKPKSSQVLVKVLSSGVCHSDIHLWEGDMKDQGDTRHLGYFKGLIYCYGQ